MTKSAGPGQDLPGGEAASSDEDPYTIRDPERFARNLAQMLEHARAAAASWSAGRSEERQDDDLAGPLVDMIRTLSQLAEFWLSDPQRMLEAQTRLLGAFMNVWTGAIRGLSGEQPGEPVPADATDRRFLHPDWTGNPFFSFFKQVYRVTVRWAEELVDEADVDEQVKVKARFYLRQVTDALSPSNFVMTNPELWRETVASGGENLARGMRMLSDDLVAGAGEFRLRQTEMTSFEVGRNIAATPGKVIGRSDLAEIIQYTPSTTQVLKRPLLICPPWINKYYILDLNREKSFIRWAVDQGHTVFAISWVNPDSRHRDKGWEAYIREGIQFALDRIEASTGETEVNAVGYCVGGTLLTAALALMEQEGDRRVRSVTLMAAQTDFRDAGDLKVFVDEDQLKVLEASMEAKGYFDGRRMAAVFNLLRSRDLIWPYVVNNYMRGREPAPFDLLYWNADATHVSAANHSFYLRNCYLQNALAEGRMEIAGRRISLRDVTLPVFNLATREDHIAPAASVYRNGHVLGGPVEFVLAGSGHIAGVINPPLPGKYRFWTGGGSAPGLADWLARAKETPGSWWPYWQKWIERQDNRKLPARQIDQSVSILGDAPGTYVKIRV